MGSSLDWAGDLVLLISGAVLPVATVLNIFIVAFEGVVKVLRARLVDHHRLAEHARSYAAFQDVVCKGAI